MSSTKILLEEKGAVEIALEDRCSLEISPRSHASAFVTDTSIPSWLYSIFVCIALVLASRRKPVCSIQGASLSFSLSLSLEQQSTEGSASDPEDQANMAKACFLHACCTGHHLDPVPPIVAKLLSLHNVQEDN